ncbi:MAG: CDP-diacylglycerol--glycerol-3-phosphate 3-phosphatidyltransferase [Pirellulales bacterium]|nr:CDP-diacylglycerol--glycerol-3-phosphate 3-phosphatidyltransferase [Pirellulales bacterium]
MSVETKNATSSSLPREELSKVAFNLPNQLTWARLILAVIMFVAMGLQWYVTSFVLFVIAAGTDWLDGYFARKYDQVTTLGRILDPFADKFIICGAFIYLAAAGILQPGFHGYMPAWVVVVIVGRELLVTALRGFMEQHGVDFSAKMAGKLKMVLQCLAAGGCLVVLAILGNQSQVPAWVEWTTKLSVWAAIVLTIYSGLEYILAVGKGLQRK